MSHSRYSLEDLFQVQIRSLALTLRPATVSKYRTVSCGFLFFLRSHFPQLHRLSELRRDPHLLGWFRWLCERNPPLSNATRCFYLIALRRLFHDLAANGHALRPDLIRVHDLPPLPRYLPRALSPSDDFRLQQELRRMDDLAANALLLTRATGIRIGECVELTADCVRRLGEDQWALHVPLGKLHTERLVPIDEEVRRIAARILALRGATCPAALAHSEGKLLPRANPSGLLLALRKTLRDAAQRADCSGHVTPHHLRHSWATEMLRLGISLPALMQLLGHKDIRMTLRYLTVTQQDLQREFHNARQNAIESHLIPQLASPASPVPVTTDLAAICQSLTATRHLLEMYRRRIPGERKRRKLQRLDKRLFAVAIELTRLATAPE